MSKRELFIELTPQIAEIIAEVQNMPRERYEEWKKEWLAECERTTPTVLELTKEVIIVIDTYLEEHHA